MGRPFFTIGVFILWVAFSPHMMAQSPTIVLSPKWTAQAQFAGYYVAEKLGFYQEEGVNVHVLHPAVSESSFSYLKKGKAQAAVMNLSYALMEQSAGTRLINVMQTSQENSLMLVGRFSFKGLPSLQNKSIAVWNHLSEELLDRIASHYQLQVDWIRFNNGINLFISGAVDICLVGSYNEFPQLAECGVKVDSTRVLRFADYGYDLPEDGLYVTEEFYQQYPDAVRKMVRACIRGWEWANEHREEALDIVMEQVHLHNIGTNRYHQRKMLEEILRLQVDKQCGKRTYRLSREGFDRAVRILVPGALQRNDGILYGDFVK